MQEHSHFEYWEQLFKIIKGAERIACSEQEVGGVLKRRVHESDVMRDSPGRLLRAKLLWTFNA